MKDPELRSVSLHARGLWIDLLCMMSESDPRGYLQINGKAPSETQLARMVGCTEEEISRGLSELSAAGVFSSTKTGVIFSRRMVKDDNLIKIRKKCGKMGGNPAFKRGLPNPYYDTQNEREDKQKDNQIDKQTDNQKITPSSSSSSSKSIKTPIPENFIISDRVKEWAVKNNFNHLEEHLEAFQMKCHALGYKYVNWDSAFMGAIRDNWAKIDNTPPKKPQRLPTREEELAEFNRNWTPDNERIST